MSGLRLAMALYGVSLLATLAWAVSVLLTVAGVAGGPLPPVVIIASAVGIFAAKLLGSRSVARGVAGE